MCCLLPIVLYTSNSYIYITGYSVKIFWGFIKISELLNNSYDYFFIIFATSVFLETICRIVSWNRVKTLNGDEKVKLKLRLSIKLSWRFPLSNKTYFSCSVHEFVTRLFRRLHTESGCRSGEQRGNFAVSKHVNHLAATCSVSLSSRIHMLIKFCRLSYKLEPYSGPMLFSRTSQIAFRLPLSNVTKRTVVSVFPSVTKEPHTWLLEALNVCRRKYSALCTQGELLLRVFTASMFCSTDSLPSFVLCSLIVSNVYTSPIFLYRSRDSSPPGKGLFVSNCPEIK